MAEEPRTAGASVTSKVLTILGAFEGSPNGLSLTEIANKTGYPLSTIHRLVGELREWGALHRDASGRYRVGMRLWELGQNARYQARERARPVLQDVFQVVRETTHLAIRSGADILYIDRIYRKKKLPRLGRAGARLPLHVDAVGKVLLAYEDESFQESYLEGDLRAMTPRTRTDPELLRAELRQTRVNGYATAVQEVRLNSCSIAVPVRRTDGRVEAAVGLLLPVERRGEMLQHLPALRAGAREMARIGDPFSIGDAADIG